MKNYKPVEILKTLDMPVLFLQGDRDYQVTNEDLKLWKTGYLEKELVVHFLSKTKSPVY